MEVGGSSPLRSAMRGVISIFKYLKLRFEAIESYEKPHKSHKKAREEANLIGQRLLNNFYVKEEDVVPHLASFRAERKFDNS